jgi:ParB family chromosome partitioning protein
MSVARMSLASTSALALLAGSAHEVRRLLTDSKVTTGHRLFKFVGSEAYAEAGGGMTRDLFAKDDEGFADDPALVQRLAEERFEAMVSEAEAAGWGEVIASEQTPYESYQWHRLYPDEVDGYSDEARQGAVLLITVTGDGSTTTTAYTKRAKRTVTTETGGMSLPRPIYDAKTTEALSRIRTTALQAEVAANTRVAHAVLLDALLPMLGGYAPSHAVQLRAGSGIQQPVTSYDLNDLTMTGPFDGVAELYAAVPDDAEARFAWLLTLDEHAIACLLAACAGALIDATEGKFVDRGRMASADRIARAVNLDMRQHWEGGHEFFDRLGKKALLEGLTEACGPAAADNCAKMKRADLAVACADRIPGRGWLPPALRTPEVEIEAAEDERIEIVDDVDGDDEGYLNYDPANDEGELAVAAE